MDGKDELIGRIIGGAIEVHRRLGPGLLESAYRRCLAHELSLRGISFEMEKEVPVEYKGPQLDCAYRIDLLVEDRVILELKTVDTIPGVHKAQLLTYMKLTGMTSGLLINLHVELLKDGIQRFKL